MQSVASTIPVLLLDFLGLLIAYLSKFDAWQVLQIWSLATRPVHWADDLIIEIYIFFPLS